MNNIWPVLMKIRIHPLTWALLALGVLTARFTELLLMFMVVLCHELGHAFAAQLFGWRIKSVTLLPFGGELETDEHGNRPWQEELIVLAAGPVQHIWILGVTYFFYVNGFISEYMYTSLILFNFIVLFVNLAPIWPLDGGKVLFVLLSKRLPFLHAHRLIIMISAVSLLFALIGLIAVNPLNVNWWMVFGFLIFSLWKEWKHRQFVFMRFLMERHYGHNLDIRGISRLEAEKDMMIYKILEDFRRDNKHIIIVKHKDEEVGKLDESELLHACFTTKLAHRPIGELLYPY